MESSSFCYEMISMLADNRSEIQIRRQVMPVFSLCLNLHYVREEVYRTALYVHYAYNYITE